MKLLAKSLCLCLVLAVCLADLEPEPPAVESNDHDHKLDELDRCGGMEMDAVTVNEHKQPYFFKGDHLYKGFHGKAELSNASYEELDNLHELDHVDAAFIMHFNDVGTVRDHIFFFLNDKVFSYDHDKLVDGYPKNISEDFPGIPDHLDAAVECPKTECDEDSVIFFKGNETYFFNVETKAVDKKDFEGMPNCTSAFRYMNKHYCFHGQQFTKFNPKTGEIRGMYPKEARGFFMRCPEYKNDNDHDDRARCSHVHLDAVSYDDSKTLYAFRGHHFVRQREGNLTSGTIDTEFEVIHSDVDAAFAFMEELYLIKASHLFAYKSGTSITLMDGYPKSLKTELGIDGHVDAAFVCQGSIVYIIQGQQVREVDMMSYSPRSVNKQQTFSLISTVDAAMCGDKGVDLVVGNHYYRFDNPEGMFAARSLPEQHRVAEGYFDCDD